MALIICLVVFSNVYMGVRGIIKFREKFEHFLWVWHLVTSSSTRFNGELQDNLIMCVFIEYNYRVYRREEFNASCVIDCTIIIVLSNLCYNYNSTAYIYVSSAFNLLYLTIAVIFLIVKVWTVMIHCKLTSKKNIIIIL